LVWSIWRHLRTTALRTVYLRQLYFSGAQSTWLVVLSGASLAVVLNALIRQQYGRSSEFTLHLLASIGLEYIAPVFLSLLVIARSASAIASELAAMQVNGEIRLLRRHGISPYEYLVAPRVVGLIAGCVLLFGFFALGALFTGALLATPLHPLATLERLAVTQGLGPVRAGLLRCAMFGTVIGLTASLLGLNAPRLTTEIPRAASRAVVMSLLLVLLANAVAAFA